MINSDRPMKDTEERTLATSSPILINGSNFVIRELNDVTRSETVERASGALEIRSWGSFALDVWACSSALPATADVDSSIIRRNSLAWMGFPSLSTKNSATLYCQVFNIGKTNRQLDVTYPHSSL